MLGHAKAVIDRRIPRFRVQPGSGAQLFRIDTGVVRRGFGTVPGLGDELAPGLEGRALAALVYERLVGQNENAARDVPTIAVV